ncbi:MAG: hypothetical protein AAF891_04240 [Pseudomonadota bacterium]
MAIVALLLGLGLLGPLLLGGFGGGSENEDTTPDTSGEMDTAEEMDSSQDVVPLDRFISGADTPDGFNIELALFDEWTPEQEAAIIEATEYLSDIILADAPDTIDPSTGAPIDDLLLTVRAESFSTGPLGGIIGDAQVLDTRTEDGLPTIANLRVSPDLDIATFRATVLHEMFHALGIGDDVFFNNFVVNDATGQPRFTGTNAIAAYQQEFAAEFAADPNAALGLPLDSQGAHWDERIFGDVLLTPEDTSGTANVAAITLAALEDIGYDTVWDNVNSQTDRTGPLVLPTFMRVA